MVEGAEADVPPFPGQRRVAVLAVGNEAGNAQAGTGTDDGNRRVIDRRGTTHLQQLALGQVRDGQRLGGEVVQDDQRVQFQRLTGRFNGKCPVVIGHLHPVAHHRVGDGNGRMLDVGVPGLLQIGTDGGVEAVVIRRGQRFDVFEFLRGNFQRKACVGSSHIGNQTGPVTFFFCGFGSGHGICSLNRQTVHPLCGICRAASGYSAQDALAFFRQIFSSAGQGCFCKVLRLCCLVLYMGMNASLARCFAGLWPPCMGDPVRCHLSPIASLLPGIGVFWFLPILDSTRGQTFAGAFWRWHGKKAGIRRSTGFSVLQGVQPGACHGRVRPHAPDPEFAREPLQESASALDPGSG